MTAESYDGNPCFAIRAQARPPKGHPSGSMIPVGQIIALKRLAIQNRSLTTLAAKAPDPTPLQVLFDVRTTTLVPS